MNNKMFIGYDIDGNVVMHVDPAAGIFIGGAFKPEHMRPRMPEPSYKAEIFDGTQTFGEDIHGYDEVTAATHSSRSIGIPSLLEGIEQRHVLMPTRGPSRVVAQTKLPANILD